MRQDCPWLPVDQDDPLNPSIRACNDWTNEDEEFAGILWRRSAAGQGWRLGRHRDIGTAEEQAAWQRQRKLDDDMNSIDPKVVFSHEAVNGSSNVD